MRKSIRIVTAPHLKAVESRISSIGIDLGDRFSHLVALDSNGEVLTEGRLSTTAVAFEAMFASVSSQMIAIETGTHSPWVSRLLKRLGHQVVVANSRKLRLIYENRNKNDRVDAEYLARLVRLDRKLLYPIEHRTAGAQQHVAILRARDAMVRTRSRLIGYVRGAIKSAGVRVPACSAEAFVKRATPVVPAELGAALMPMLALVGQLNAQIASFDRQVERLASDTYPQAKILTQISGVGPLTAVAFIVTIDDPARFCHSRTVGPWLGLVPARRSSGDSDPQQRITREGDQYLRHLLVNCSHYILGPFGPDCDLRRYGVAIAARGGKNAKKRAVVAVARKLAVMMHRLWRTRAVYEPLRNAAVQSAAVA